MNTTAKPASTAIQTHITDQCALFARPEDDFRVDVLVAVGDRVEQGAPVLRSRRHPELALVAPVAGEVAAIDLGPGRRLSHMVFFHDPRGGRHTHDISVLRSRDVGSATRSLLLSAGLWTAIRSRPFGRVPLPDEVPSAIFVMAADTRPDAPSPALALEGREEAFGRGLRALATMTAGPVIVCHDKLKEVGRDNLDERIQQKAVIPVHPHGLAGFQIAARHPAQIGRAVWDIHAEDVAGIGAFLETGLVPETRLVSVSGPALRECRVVRCQPGADVRALCFDILHPGPHKLFSGSSLDGIEGRWLGNRHRQVTAVAEASTNARYWFASALRRAGGPLPIIPTAALDQAFGGVLPASPLARAISANDAEGSVRLGALSLVEEDLALADYVTSAAPRLADMLRAMLDRIAAEAVP